MKTIEEKDTKKILSEFPKQRSVLPEEFSKIYEQEYVSNREGQSFLSSIAQKLEQWMHKQVAKNGVKPVLEVGCGTLNHLKFESIDMRSHYDVVEPFVNLYQGNENIKSIRNVYKWLADVPTDHKYKRIISVAVFEHMDKLPEETARCGTLLDIDGVLKIGIPSEGGLLWYFAWRFGTGLGFWLRNKLDYGVLMRHEHVNNANEIVAVMNIFFNDVKIKRFPFPFLQGSLYTYIEARNPDIDCCRAYLKQVEHKI